MQMLRLLRALLLLLVSLPLVAGEAAPGALAHLLQARNELGTANWSTVVHLTSPDQSRPAEDALVFEFADALWFYRPCDGTQSLSRRWHNVDTDRRQLSALIQGINPAYTSCREYLPEEIATTNPSTAPLPNGCFIQSVGEARRLARHNGAVNGCLLSYYAMTKDGQRGHTVLYYEDAKGSHLFDPAEGTTTKAPALSLGEEALKLAQSITPFGLARQLTKAAKIALLDGDTGSGRKSSTTASQASARTNSFR